MLAGGVGSDDSDAMTTQRTRSAPAGCYVISLRPVGEHGGIRRAAAAHGARVLALSPWRLQRRDDDATCIRLRMAIAADIVIATSPEAVRAAAALQPLSARAHVRWIAVGASTARALREAGIAHVDIPTRMDSEGLLALPALADVDSASIGLLTAPGGRKLIEPALQSRGATVHRADVYARVDVAPSARSIATLRALHAAGTPRWLALSSGGALDALVAGLDADATVALRASRVVAASARLAAHARALWFDAPVIADDARPRSLIAAIAEAESAVASGRGAIR